MSRALALLGCALVLTACSRDRKSGGATAAASAARPAPAEDDHDHNAHPAYSRDLAPSVVALDPAARGRVTSLYISSPKSGVTIVQESGGWVTAYAPRCAVAPERVAAALNYLTTLTSRPTSARIESGADFRLKVVVYAEDRAKLLKLSLGPSSPGGVLGQLDDKSSVELPGFRFDLFSAESDAWCLPAEPR